MIARSAVTVFRQVFHFAVALLLVTALFSGACFACAPVKAAGCCDPAGHCKKISKSCENHLPALLSTAPAPVELTSAYREAIAPPQPAYGAPFTTSAQLSAPDLCLLHSILLI